MKKEETYYEQVDPIEWAESYTFEEFLKLVGTPIEPDPIFLNKARTLKTTIVDGDYTLREDIDYEIRYFRGHGGTEAVWAAIAIGKGNYDTMFFCAGEYSLPASIREMRWQPGFEEYMNLFYPEKKTDDTPDQDD